MDFGLLIDSVELSKMNIFLFALFFLWYTTVLGMLISVGRKRGDTTMLAGVPGQVLFPIGAIGLFLFSTHGLYRYTINAQVIFGVLFLLYMLNYIFTWRMLDGRYPGSIVTNDESERMKKKITTYNWMCSLLSSTMFGLFAGSHYLDDGNAAMMLLAMVFLLLNYVVESLMPCSAVVPSADCVKSNFRESTITTIFGGVVGILIGWLMAPEPTVVMTLFGIVFLGVSIGLNKIAINQARHRLMI